MKRTIVNPYAKNKKPKTNASCSSSTATTSNSVTNANNANQVSATIVPVQPTTFSQAFSSSTVDNDDDHNLKQQLATQTATANIKQQHESNSNGDTKTPSSSLILMQQQPHVLHISTRQRGNPILRHLRNVPFAYVSDLKPDYLMSPQRCALFLSIKYHNLYPTYIHRRIAEIQTDYDLRILLCLVDVQDNTKPLLVLNKLAVINNMTLILAWTEEEAARYLETFKALETKDASTIQKRETTDYIDQIHHVLCHSNSKVNKTDATQLLSQFGSMKRILTASVEELSLCPGIGEKKVKRLWDAFHKPFQKNNIITK